MVSDSIFDEFIKLKERHKGDESKKEKNIDYFINYLFIVYYETLEDYQCEMIDMAQNVITEFINSGYFTTTELIEQLENEYNNIKNINIKNNILIIMLNDIAYIYSYNGKEIFVLSLLKNVIKRIEEIKKSDK